MKCRVKFLLPTCNHEFYFVDFREAGDELKPVGCRMLRRYRDKAMIFETKRDAMKVVNYLLSMGYKAQVCRVSL